MHPRGPHHSLSATGLAKVKQVLKGFFFFFFFYSLGLGKHHTQYCKLLSGVLYIRLEKSFYLQSPGTSSGYVELHRVFSTTSTWMLGMNDIILKRFHLELTRYLTTLTLRSLHLLMYRTVIKLYKDGKTDLRVHIYEWYDPFFFFFYPLHHFTKASLWHYSLLIKGAFSAV